MPKELLNEAERYLVEHWAEARLLEESMKDVRAKYKEVFERIIEAVTEAHPKLDAHRVHVKQSWSDGEIGFGKKSWPTTRYGSPSGFWVSNLRLEILTAEDSDSPFACIWVPEKSNLDFEAARIVVNEAAKNILTPEEHRNVVFDESGGTLMWWPAPSKGEFLSALCKADGQEFVELCVSQFDLMARFIPVLDKVFRECLRKE